MNKLISDELKSMIHYQIGHEIYNANLYLFIASFLKNKGLDNLAKIFEHQHEEESGHALEFVNLLTDLNTDVIIPAIDSVDMSFSSLANIAKLYLEREILTTESINKIKHFASQEDNPVVIGKMQEMIKKQQLEYAEATTFLDKSELITEWWQAVLWDAAYDN